MSADEREEDEVTDPTGRLKEMSWSLFTEEKAWVEKRDTLKVEEKGMKERHRKEREEFNGRKNAMLAQESELRKRSREYEEYRERLRAQQQEQSLASKTARTRTGKKNGGGGGKKGGGGGGSKGKGKAPAGEKRAAERGVAAPWMGAGGCSAR